MKTITIELPSMYGDHHVIEVRRILLEISGVEDVFASSAFQVVEVTYDPEDVSEDDITEKLEKSGYQGDWQLPIEADASTYLESDRSQSYFRHTEDYGTSGQVVSFAQNVSYSGRPLWNCPGIGVIKTEMED
jgi:copper chaperone CopZ